MSLLVTALRQAGQLVSRPVSAINTIVGRNQLTAARYGANSLVARTASSQQGGGKKRRPAVQYDAYQNYNHYTPSPYKPSTPRRYGYEPKHHTGGPLPRIAGDEKPLPMPDYKVKDSWAPKRALYGQNDYIDILGDGSIQPQELIQGPPWLRGFRGNEMQRLIRKLGFEGDRLKEESPTELHNIRKRIFFLYKQYNHKRSHKAWWSRHRVPRQNRVRNPYTY